MCVWYYIYIYVRVQACVFIMNESIVELESCVLTHFSFPPPFGILPTSTRRKDATCDGDRRRIEDIEEDAPLEFVFPPPPPLLNSQPAFQLDGVGYAYPGSSTQVVRNVTMRVEAVGDRIAFVGE